MAVSHLLFLHAGLWHILFNMLALWMFGAQLETDWGYNLFMQFYFFCGIGAALVTVAVSFTGFLAASPYTQPSVRQERSLGFCSRSESCMGTPRSCCFPFPF